MCGIVGYVGYQEAYPMIIAGLHRLEYRGYDSAGIAVFDGYELSVRKAEGRIERLSGPKLPGTIGIGHTRWATHGPPTERNAHPHVDCDGKIAVVHNGIIENYLDIKDKLIAEGHLFTSDTDTEVIAHLLEALSKQHGGDFQRVFPQALAELQGSFAVAAFSVQHPEQVFIARQDSPLVVGVSDGEVFFASDIPAILPFTRDIYVLDDQEYAVLTQQAISFFDVQGRAVHKHKEKIEWSVDTVEKGGFDHFMIKEIREQPQAVRETIKHYYQVNQGELKIDYHKVQRIFLVAMGTARHGALLAREYLEKITGIPTIVELASEFRYGDPLVGPDCLTIAVSQSGETADTLGALREAKRRGSQTLALTNTQGSSIGREAGNVLLTRAGVEIAVASTKAYTTQVLLSLLWALDFARNIGRSYDKELDDAIRRIPLQMEKVLEDFRGFMEDFANTIKNEEHVFFMGRGLDWAVSQEGALKLKEISYIHAEAYSAAELKHGTLALIEEGVPVVVLCTNPLLAPKMVSNVKEVKARGGFVCAMVSEKITIPESVCDLVFTLPETHDLLAPLISVIPLQLLAYYTALSRGCDVDKPRNLAKSVTVE